MKVTVRQIANQDDQQVILECVRLTRDFEDIRQYALAKGGTVLGYLDNGDAFNVNLSAILYFEALGELVFAYTTDKEFLVKRRLYELENDYARQRFARASKSILLNLMSVEAFKPAMNGRLYARLRNGEDVLVSRQYAKDIKAALTGV